ncbi:acyl-CoA thioesterase [Nitriliruptor alkaliphilus]|uniref:acyl-CoA thioesterase n=1 Tax=Nitriliruptor alkaliphilus TaxID=427918 RepID=UPI000695AD78|nr:thioesterase family protein [Nitriliruptor alkaliphilus]
MSPAQITVTRPLEWMDTDAAGIWHHSTAIRFLEHAELELHRQLGIVDTTFGFTPRARMEIDFHEAVRFGDDVRTTLIAARVGRTSIAYDFVLEGPRGRYAGGKLITVLVDGEGKPRPIPDDLRAALTERGDVS